MEKRDTIIVGLIFAAFVLMLAFDWRRIFSMRDGTEAATVVGASDAPDTGTGPAYAWANVPTTRYLMPPPLGGFVSARASSVPDAPAQLYDCGGC